jgi:hypothetical protein
MLIALFASSAIAQVSINLPWKGSYQPGQFMPVIVTAQGAARDGKIVLSAHGALPTMVDMHGQSEAAVPMLMLTAGAERMSWSLDGSPPREIDLPLTADWNEVPDAIGPNSAIAGPDVYSPTLGWSPGASARVRRVSVLSAVLMAILLLAGAMLLRGRRAIVAICFVVTLSVGAIEIVRRNISPIWRAEGQIIVVGVDGVAQFDTWQYVSTRATADTTIELPKGAWPVFVDPQHAREVQASLRFDAARNILSLHVRLEPQMTVAVLTRRMTESAPAPPSTTPITRAIRSPMGELARSLYVARETRIVDEGSVQWIDDQLLHWASVVLWREDHSSQK